MPPASYLFEKACYAPECLARVAEDLKLLPTDSVGHRETSAYLNVALRHALRTCCEIAGEDLDPQWTVDLARDGSSAWKQVKQDLEESLFGPLDEEEELLPGAPRSLEPEEEPDLDAAEVVEAAAATLSALVDLADVLRKHGCYELHDGNLRGYVGTALNALKVVFLAIQNAEEKWGRPDRRTWAQARLQFVIHFGDRIPS
ncbi:MAG: hypothetical protein AB7N76_12730 [Planctomycetota bacterium]